jgi:HSP20 family protein
VEQLQQLRRGLNRAWDGLVEGWQHLWHNAAEAVTRFTPSRQDASATDTRALLEQASQWGVLPAEVRETDDDIRVRLEAPGMEPDDFDLQVQDDLLVIRGEKRASREDRSGSYLRVESAYGQFERAIPLPGEVDADGARAQYRQGVLHVTLPKSARNRSRRVEVQTG